MNSDEILRRYIGGELSHADAVKEAETCFNERGTFAQTREAAKAGYVLGFLQRLRQWKRGLISGRDMCLNLRDIILILGNFRLTPGLTDLVREYGQEFGIFPENGFAVCVPKPPNWMEPQEAGRYVNEVYALKAHAEPESEEPSAGDALLQDSTVFRSYKNFEQKLAVHTALSLPDGYTLLISQPTGGGKSLVTQMLTAHSDGLTVVIVPTVALAMDQYGAAQKNLINNGNIFYYRGQQTAQNAEILRAVWNRTARLLFTSPEAIFKNQGLFSALEQAAADGYLANIVIDEAHIVPDWGAFFRPDFQVFSVILRKWRTLSCEKIRVFLLSATLSDDVVETLFSLFGQAGRNAQFRCDTLRHEPRFLFSDAKSRDEQTEKVMDALRLLPKPMVVYVLEPKDAEALREELKKRGFQNIPAFTGSTKTEERERILTGWKNHEYDVIIGTSAFGIGVDKPDVRTIVHACVPENLSRFYQEVGRAGRDHLPSLSLLIPYRSYYDGEGDTRRARGLVNKVMRPETAAHRWFGMRNGVSVLLSADRCTLDTSATPGYMSDEEAEYAGNLNGAWNINLLLFLHRSGYIELEDAAFSPETDSYHMTAKLLKPEALRDVETLTRELQEPRQQELESQLEGYQIIRNLVQNPTRRCWGRTFRQLFPLAKEICNGCPHDPQGRVTWDSPYKLRVKPELEKPPGALSAMLKRRMGLYRFLIIRKSTGDAIDREELRKVCDRAAALGVKALVLPEALLDAVSFPGLVLTYAEFYFTAEYAPYLFADSVLCVFDNNAGENASLYQKLEKLASFGYRCLLYCHERMSAGVSGKSVLDSANGYRIDSEGL